MVVPHESENARQHAFPSYVACRTGRGVLPIPGRVGVRRERGRLFPFTGNVPVCCEGSKVYLFSGVHSKHIIYLFFSNLP